MLSYSRESLKRPYIGAVEDYFVYDGDDPFILETILFNYTWAPVVWSNCERKRLNFYKSNYCALDFDSPETSLDWALRQFCDCWHIIGTTRSHQKEKRGVTCDRYRVLLKWEKPIVRLDDYEFTMKSLIKELGADPSCSDGAHCFYRCSDIVSRNFDPEAYCEDVREAPSEAERNRAREKYFAACDRAASLGLLPRYMRWFLSNVVPGVSKHKPRFQFACEAARAGYSFEQAMQMLLSSPSYKDTVIDSNLMTELERVMRGGFERAYADLKTSTTPET